MGRGLDGSFLACVQFSSPAGARSLPASVVIARGKHLFPFRTEPLSLSAPMVLGGKPPGRVGRRRDLSKEPPSGAALFVPRSVAEIERLWRLRLPRRSGPGRHGSPQAPRPDAHRRRGGPSGVPPSPSAGGSTGARLAHDRARSREGARGRTRPGSPDRLRDRLRRGASGPCPCARGTLEAAG